MLPLRFSEKGPILAYLEFLRGVNPKLFDKTVAAVRAVMSTEDGVMLLELLEKSTKDSLTPILSDTRALEARNAQSFIPLDLRRIMSDETEQLLSRKAEPDAGRKSIR